MLGGALLLSAAVCYMTDMPGESFAGPAPPLSPEEALLRERLAGHVAMLAGEIGERNVWHPAALEAAAGYIEQTFRDLGYRVAEQVYQAQGMEVRNLEAALEGASPAREIVVVGAHYDSVMGSPGANDNASGVAALLEIARLVAGHRPARSLRLVAFTNEESPFFRSSQMGSQVYARRCRERGEDIVAMLALETIGYYTDTPNSQHYPNPLYGLAYPHTGDFLAFVANLSSRRLLRRCLGSFRAHTAFPCQGVAAPGWLAGVHWSDHWSFWREGYPALMITDTALFRYPHYHAPTDTPGRLDYPGLARVTAGLARLVTELVQGAP